MRNHDGWVEAGVALTVVLTFITGFGVIELVDALTQGRRSLSFEADAQIVVLITSGLSAPGGAAFGKWAARLAPLRASVLNEHRTLDGVEPALRGRWGLIFSRALLLFVLLPGFVQALLMVGMPRF
jgi:hypothetical protein